jgi:hypothetical protein
LLKYFIAPRSLQNVSREIVSSDPFNIISKKWFNPLDTNNESDLHPSNNDKKDSTIISLNFKVGCPKAHP